MSVRSGQSVTTTFVTTNYSTGAAANADSGPTGTLYVNGTADAASVTVTNITTGLYKAAVTLPTLAVGDVVSIVIAATVNSVAGKGKVWEDTKDVFAGAIPDVVAGGSGGLFIAGTNAATTVTTSFTTTFTGNLTGSVASVSGNVGGNVVGTVAGVTPATAANILTTALTESYSTDGSAATLSQLLYQIWALLSENSISGTTMTVKKIDGSTTAMTLTLNSANQPTAITRAT